MTKLRAAARALRRAVPDVLAVAGVGLIAYGSSFVHPALPPVTLGLGCLVAVRYGAR